ncbi:MAG: beta-N-acetylhexosaminidase [bacterium]
MNEIRKKVGQMLMFGFSGTELNDSVRAMIREQKIGGVILFAANIVEPDQVRQLCRDFQDWNRQAGSEFPLLIAIDQEGGRVSRIPWLVERYPDPVLLGNRSLEDAFQFGYGLAQELANLGITVDLAPVLDVLSNPGNTLLARRCLGTEAKTVADRGEAMIRGFHAGGVLATGKHFPGHGDVTVDSHLRLPVSDCTLETLWQRELVPFVRAIQAGLSIIMTAHIKYTHLDPDYPATLSPKIIQGLLRGQLGFQGLVITDDMTMKAIAHHFTPKEAALAAVRAGADIVLVCHEPDQQLQAWEALMDGYQRDEEIRSAIDLASRRIIDSKLRRNILQGHKNIGH